MAYKVMHLFLGMVLLWGDQVYCTICMTSKLHMGAADVLPSCTLYHSKPQLVCNVACIVPYLLLVFVQELAEPMPQSNSICILVLCTFHNVGTGVV